MAVTDDQVALLRTLLAGDWDENSRLTEQLDRTGGWDGYSALLGAAFFEAVDRRFGEQSTQAEIIQFVADARAQFDEMGKDFDPVICERLVRAMLGDGSVEDLDHQVVTRAQVMLLGALVTIENPDDATLDEFMAEVRKLADDWLANN